MVAVSEGDLSTISLGLPVGASFHEEDRRIMKAYTEALRIADLECPTWGINNSLDADGYRTLGPPYNLVISPPLNLISLDPTWARCTSYLAFAWVGYEGVCRSLRNEVFDPP